jgi:hypothetical protein
MAKKKHGKKKSHGRRSKKAQRRRGHAKAKHVRRGCGKRNWRRGGNAYWKCKVGKKHAYKS